MNIEFESMAIQMPAVLGHPNREPFHGVLTLVDVFLTRHQPEPADIGSC